MVTLPWHFLQLEYTAQLWCHCAPALLTAGLHSTSPLSQSHCLNSCCTERGLYIFILMHLHIHTQKCMLSPSCCSASAFASVSDLHTAKPALSSATYKQWESPSHTEPASNTLSPRASPTFGHHAILLPAAMTLCIQPQLATSPAQAGHAPLGQTHRGPWWGRLEAWLGCLILGLFYASPCTGLLWGSGGGLFPSYIPNLLFTLQPDQIRWLNSQVSLKPPCNGEPSTSFPAVFVVG